MDPLFTAITTSVVAAAGITALVNLGMKIYELRHARMSWLRNQKADHYAKLLSIYLELSLDATSGEKNRDLDAFAKEYLELISRARLFAPKKVDDALGKLAQFGPPTEHPESIDRFLELLEEVTKLLRQDLGVK